MSDNNQGVIHGASAGSLAGKHRLTPSFRFTVGPSTSGEFNTARLRLIPIACWRVDDIRFAFDSSFITSDITKEIQILLDVREAHKQRDKSGKDTFPPLSIFGHADPVGTDEYNKGLSGRRATAIYAVLISNAERDEAVRLWQRIAKEEEWGASQRQAMQAATGLPDRTADNALFRAYMQKLCPPELRLTRQDFLAQGSDPGGKGDYQGCSRFNPLLIFSQAREAQFEKDRDKTARNNANAINRRVLALLFRIGSRVDATKWPCPRATEGIAGCLKRFWSDAKRRRSTQLPDRDRQFVETTDTFGCRFYQRISDSSPCEQVRTTDFLYGLELRDDLPWSDDAQVRILSEDDVQKQLFRMQDGQAGGDFRTFLFRGCRPGVRYRGEIQDGDVLLELFPFTELFKIQDPNDPFDILPLLDPNQFGNEPDDDPGIPVTVDPNDSTILDSPLVPL